MNVDRTRNPRQHGGGKQQSNDQLDRLHVSKRYPFMRRATLNTMQS